MQSKQRELLFQGAVLGTEFALMVSLSIIIFFLIGMEFGKIYAGIMAVIGAILGLAFGTYRMVKSVEKKDENK